MSDIAPATPLRLEVLPDEILLEIFQYIKPIDLLSFKGHNQRLNNIIRDVKLSIVTEYSDDDDEIGLAYLTNFATEQVISLDLSYGCAAFDLNVFQQLRSLTLNCGCLLENQLDQVFSIKLPHLERISIDNVPHCFNQELLLIILDNEHLPSLKTCQYTGGLYSFVEINDHYQLPNNKIRALIISQWYGSQLGLLFDLLPNLHRLEANINGSVNWLSDVDKPHTSLADVRVTLNDLSNDLNAMLQFMPNLRRLRVRGKINENSVLECFEKLKKIIHSHTPTLQRFDCELYFHSWVSQVAAIVIQQLTPLFKNIQCLLGNNSNECYTTDLAEYPPFCEYAYVERTINHVTSYSGVMNGYDSDDDYCQYDRDNDYDHDDEFNNGLSYRENYKRLYMCSPWSGNNDDY